MPIQSTCPGCKTQYEFADKLLGNDYSCQECEQRFKITDPDLVDASEFEVVDESDADSSHATSSQNDDSDRLDRQVKKRATAKRRAKNDAFAETRKEQIPDWAWATGGCLLVLICCVVALAAIAKSGDSGLAQALCIAFGLGTLVNLIFLIVSVYVVSFIGVGIELGDVRVAIPKALAIVMVATMVSFVPIAGWFLFIVVWCGGLVSLFGLDFWESRVLFLINWGFAILGSRCMTCDRGRINNSKGQIVADLGRGTASV